MSFEVPANQTVSWAVYWPSVVREADVSIDDAAAYTRQMMRAFDHGEPIWSAALELAMLVDLNRDYRPEKTPLQLAKKVVRL
jgi:hypothetical protein